MKPFVLVLIGLLVVAGCSTAEPLPTNIPLPTNTPLPTDTPEPTRKPFVNVLALELPGMEQVQVDNVRGILPWPVDYLDVLVSACFVVISSHT